MFFDRPFAPGEVDYLTADLAAWLRSPSLRWLLERVPGCRFPGGDPETLQWPAELGVGVSAAGTADLVHVLDRLGEICDWAAPGTVWDYREGGERRFAESAHLPSHASRDEVASRAADLGLRSEGELCAEPQTYVVLGGRRLAPLNRARAAARAMGRQPPRPVGVAMLCGRRSLDRAERASAEVRGYAPSARTELDLMGAAASEVFDALPDVTVRLIEIPDPAPGHRASTYETLRAVAADSEAGEGSLAIVTSPTCRPFQYLEAVRAIGLPAGRSLELIAHPPAWASGSPDAIAEPHVYLQEIRSVIQAAGRLAGDLAATGPPASPTASSA
jgi:hypothetical protein